MLHGHRNRNSAPLLPSEIVADIMAATLGYPSPLDTNGRQQFLVLRSICRTWRIITFTTQSFWRSLSIHVNSCTESSVRAWFQHGGNQAALTLVAHGGYRSSAQIPNHLTLDQLSSLITGNIWTKLGLHGLPPAFIYDLLRTTPRTVGQTHWKSNVLTIDIDMAFVDRNVCFVNSEFPYLKTLRIYNWASYVDKPPTCKANHRALTALYVIRCELADPIAFACLLSTDNIPSLQTLTLDNCNQMPVVSLDTFSQALPPVTLTSSIEKLTIIGKYSSSALKHMVVPFLRLLQIGAPNSATEDKEGHIASLIERSNPPHLHTFLLGQAYLGKEDISRIIGIVSSTIQNLALPDCGSVPYLPKNLVSLQRFAFFRSIWDEPTSDFLSLLEYLIARSVLKYGTTVFILTPPSTSPERGSRLTELSSVEGVYVEEAARNPIFCSFPSF